MKKPTGQDETLTTEKLAELAIETVERMSEEGKKQLRESMASSGNLLVDWLRRNGHPLTVENYLSFGGDPDGAEDLSEVLELIESGTLRLTVPGSKKIQ